MPFLIDVPHLVSAARQCMRRSSAPGIDEVTWAHYRREFRPRLAYLAARLRCGQWRPGPIRMVQIPTYTGKTLEAALPTVEDRIVHRAIRVALEPILDRMVLADWVSGYRPGRNRITALRHAERLLSAGLPWVADIDVAGASEGGTPGECADWLAEHVSDGSFLATFRRALEGLPSPLVPGTGLWPVVFNLRLSNVDKHLEDLPIVRFADNYAVFAADQREAQAGFEAVAAALRLVGLRPNQRKSRIRPPHLANPEDLFLIDG